MARDARDRQRTANPREILEYARTIAVVGFSAFPEKSAHSVPRRMIRVGYRVIPVNPNSPVILGMESYPDLASVPEPVDLVDVFRPSAEAAEVAEAAVAIGARALWLQQGITSPEARRIAEAAGMDYVEDHCIAVEYALSGLGRRDA